MLLLELSSMSAILPYIWSILAFIVCIDAFISLIASFIYFWLSLNSFQKFSIISTNDLFLICSSDYLSISVTPGSLIVRLWVLIASLLFLFPMISEVCIFVAFDSIFSVCRYQPLYSRSSFVALNVES